MSASLIVRRLADELGFRIKRGGDGFFVAAKRSQVPGFGYVSKHGEVQMQVPFSKWCV